MELTFLQQNPLIVALLSAVVGAILTLLTQRILNKRGLFTFFVLHYRIGVSADDAVFGTVRVTWNNQPVNNLYLSSIELRNESLKDYENVTVRVHTNDTVLLTERTEIVGTSHMLQWTKDFEHKITVPPSSQPTSSQQKLYDSQREYVIPTMNRGQRVRLTYLNAAKTGQQPTISVDILHAGVKTKFRVAQSEFFGVPQSTAAWIGSASGVVFVAVVIAIVETSWLAAVVSFLYGLIVLVPGAGLIRLWRWLRDSFGG